MAWINVPGLTGKVFLPDDVGQMQKKHPCKTCFSCQWCDENRCHVCRREIKTINAKTGRSNVD